MKTPEQHKEDARVCSYLMTYQHEYGVNFDCSFEYCFEAAERFNERFPEGTPYEDIYDWESRIDSFMEYWTNPDYDKTNFLNWKL